MKAINAGDWDLCKELARFLTSFDSSLLWEAKLIADTGNTLRQALTHVGLPAQSSTHLHINRRTSGFMLAEQSPASPGSV